jgi:hypothetical protein
VFGLAALREKLVCFDAGLDDIVLELLKAELLLQSGEAPVGDVRLRLVATDANRLRLVASQRPDPAGPPLGLLDVEMASYAKMAERAGSEWAAAATVLGQGTYVDVYRLGWSAVPQPPVAANPGASGGRV